MKCGICSRPLISPEEFKERSEKEWDGWMLEWHIDCGGDCSGCMAVAEDKAVYRHCQFHDRQCVVAKHYADATHLCAKDQCIEHRDITTLMINDAYYRYRDGEANPFFDRLLSAAEKAQRMVEGADPEA